MKKARVLLLMASVTVWGGFVWIGRDLLQGVEAKHTAGYPNTEQLRYYFITPLVMLFTAVLPPIILWRTRWEMFGTLWLVLTLFAVFPYILPYSGGV
jgi:hypothetical protein